MAMARCATPHPAKCTHLRAPLLLPTPLSLGIQYRELLSGTGREARTGNQCEMSYIVYRLGSGGYYKCVTR